MFGTVHFNQLICVCVCVLQSFDTGHSMSVTRVLHTQAMVVTASKDGSVRLHGPQDTHHVFSKQLEQGGSDQVADLDFYRSTFAVPRDRLVQVWRET